MISEYTLKEEMRPCTGGSSIDEVQQLMARLGRDTHVSLRGSRPTLVLV